jgi:hypothetical protein
MALVPEKFDLDLGSGHWLRFMEWNPDLELNPQYALLASLIAEHPKVGAMVTHLCPKTETGLHEGGISFITPLTEAVESFRKYPRWDVKSWSPLPLHPSLQSHCPCADHGFIRNGLWEKA